MTVPTLAFPFSMEERAVVMVVVAEDAEVKALLPPLALPLPLPLLSDALRIIPSLLSSLLLLLYMPGWIRLFLLASLLSSFW